MCMSVVYAPVHVSVYMCACEYRYTYVHVHTEVTLLPTLFFWVRVSHWTWNSPIWLGWPPNRHRGSSCLCPPFWSHRYALPHLTFCVAVGDLNRGPQAWMTDAVLTEAISLPSLSYFENTKRIQKPPHLIVNTWKKNSSRHRNCNKHTIIWWCPLPNWLPGENFKEKKFQASPLMD